MTSLPRQWLTRLHLKWLWLTHSYRFTWAHKPLCGRFQKDVVRLGSVHLCRSCTMAYAGIALAILLCCFLGPSSDIIATVLLACGPVTIALSLPRWYKKWARPVRDALRFSMGAMAVLSIRLLFAGHLVPGITSVVVMAAFWKVYLRLRRPRMRHACDDCEHFRDGGTTDVICPGFAFQADLIRQYEGRATELLLRSGYVPDVVRRRT